MSFMDWLDKINRALDDVLADFYQAEPSPAELLANMLADATQFAELLQQLDNHPNALDNDFFNSLLDAVVDYGNIFNANATLPPLLAKALQQRPDLAVPILDAVHHIYLDCPDPALRQALAPLFPQIVAANPVLRTAETVQRELANLDCGLRGWEPSARLLAAQYAASPHLVNHALYHTIKRRKTVTDQQQYWKDALLGVVADIILETSTPPKWWQFRQRHRHKEYHQQVAQARHQQPELFPRHLAEDQARAELLAICPGLDDAAPRLLRDAMGNPLIELADVMINLEQLATFYPPPQTIVSPMGCPATVQPAPIIRHDWLSNLQFLIYGEQGLLWQLTHQPSQYRWYAPGGGHYMGDANSLPQAEQPNGMAANLYLPAADLERALLHALRATRQDCGAAHFDALDKMAIGLQQRIKHLGNCPQIITDELALVSLAPAALPAILPSAAALPITTNANSNSEQRISINPPPTPG